MSSVSKDLSFVDTNVLVYAFDKSPSPKKAIARVLLNRLMEDDSLRVSTQVLQELFVTLTRKACRPCSSEEALVILEELTAWPVTVVDYRRFGPRLVWRNGQKSPSGTG